MASPHAAADSLRNLAPRATLDVGGGARAVRAPPATSAPEPLREQDRLLPLANVARMMTIEIPKDAKISRDSKVFMQECVTEFICFITSEAHDFSIAAGRKAITQEDVLNAMDALGARMGTTLGRRHLTAPIRETPPIPLHPCHSPSSIHNVRRPRVLPPTYESLSEAPSRLQGRVGVHNPCTRPIAGLRVTLHDSNIMRGSLLRGAPWIRQASPTSWPDAHPESLPRPGHL